MKVSVLFGESRPDDGQVLKSAGKGLNMSRSRFRSYRWVFYTSAGFLFAGAVLRAVLLIEDGAVLARALLLLLAWLVLFLSEIFLPRFWYRWFAAYLVLQCIIIVSLLLVPGTADFFAVLFAVLAMQALQRYGTWSGAAWIALFVPLTAVPLLGDFRPSEVAALVLIYLAVNLALGSSGLATRRAVEAQSANEALASDLSLANDALREHTRRQERLAVARERNRLARELHDSVTQTIFSMTLASQSAAILLDREPPEAGTQLERLLGLTQNALGEMRTLISELAPEHPIEGGLVSALRREVQRRAEDGFTVKLELRGLVGGGESGIPLSAVEEQALLRIAQEALNNVVKHSGCSEAVIRLRVQVPFSLEVVDRGLGFVVAIGTRAGGMGLASMNERAYEIGWKLRIVSSAGGGTRVVVEQEPTEGGSR